MFSYSSVGCVDSSLVTESVAITFSKPKDVGGKMQLISSLKINEEFTWTVVMNGSDVSTAFTFSTNIQSVSALQNAVNVIDCCSICTGNDDDEYSSLKDDSFTNAQGNALLSCSLICTFRQ